MYIFQFCGEFPCSNSGCVCLDYAVDRFDDTRRDAKTSTHPTNATVGRRHKGVGTCMGERGNVNTIIGGNACMSNE